MSGRSYPYGRKGGVAGYGPEKVSAIHRNLWIVQVSCFVLSAIVLFGILVASSLRVAGGFPCFFASVVDYSSANETAIRLGLTVPKLGGVVPVLFFETYGVAFFFYATSIIMLFIACYLIAGAVIVNRNIDEADKSWGPSYLMSLVAASSTILLGTVTIWLLQATVIVLAHKLIVLAASVYMVHFGILTAFYAYFTGRGIDSATYTDDVAMSKQVGSSFHRLVGNARAITVNFLSAVYGSSLIMVCLMLGMLLANSFTTGFSHVIIITLVSTSVLTLIYLLVIELLIARYVHMLIGPYIGLMVGYGLLWSATADYTSRFYFAMGGDGGNLRLTCQIVLGVFFALVLIAAIIRITRASIYHRRRFTRAYKTAKKFRAAVKDRALRLTKSGRRERRGDRMPLTNPYPTANTTYGSSDEEVIYDNVAGDALTDSEWDE